jgi:ABC-2 type transport system permease protein
VLVEHRWSPLPLGAVAFMRKEALDVLRQPRLLATLVLGPFLILLAFGVGYRENSRPFRTLFVGDPNSELSQQVKRSASQLKPLLAYEGITRDEAAARRRLADGDVDAVVVLPDDPLGTVLRGQQAELRILHDRLDPVELTLIGFAARLAVARVNATVLATIVGQGEGVAGAPIRALLSSSGSTVRSAASALDAGDLATADRRLADAEEPLRQLDLSTRSIQALAGSHGTDPSTVKALDDFRSAVVDALNTVVAARRDIAEHRTPQAQAELSHAREVIASAPTIGKQLLNVKSEVLVQPFKGEVQTIVPGRRTFTDYYAPAAVALLLQQFGVAFAALSFVRERQLGATELFRVAPISSAQIVAGKYVGHFIVGALVAALLTGLVLALGVPLAGSVASLAVLFALLVVASIGLGFIISLTSLTDMQAVLSTMLIMLAAIFFSGFFLAFDELKWPFQAVSWVLPATYAIGQARDVMLRGASLDPQTTAGLAGYALLTLLIVALLTRRRTSMRS